MPGLCGSGRRSAPATHRASSNWWSRCHHVSVAAIHADRGSDGSPPPWAPPPTDLMTVVGCHHAYKTSWLPARHSGEFLDPTATGGRKPVHAGHLARSTTPPEPAELTTSNTATKLPFLAVPTYLSFAPFHHFSMVLKSGPVCQPNHIFPRPSISRHCAFLADEILQTAVDITEFTF